MKKFIKTALYIFISPWLVFGSKSAFAQNQQKIDSANYKPDYFNKDTFFASPYKAAIATYPGGETAFIDFVSINMHLPANIKISNKSTIKVIDSVFVNFEIEKNGTVSGVTLTNSINEKTDLELVKAIKLSMWNPARASENNNSVAGGYFIKIYFLRK